MSYPEYQKNKTGFNRSQNQRSSYSKPEIETPKFDFENITVELFSKTAESYAIECSKDKGKNKSTQLRRFYDEIVMWEERSQTIESFKNNLPFIYMIKWKVAYAVGRNNIDEVYQHMMYGVIDGIKENNPKTLKNAKLFLEAFMGYYKDRRGDQ